MTMTTTNTVKTKTYQKTPSAQILRKISIGDVIKLDDKLYKVTISNYRMMTNIDTRIELESNEDIVSAQFFSEDLTNRKSTWIVSVK